MTDEIDRLFEPPAKTIRWAREAFAEMKSAHDAFLDSDPLGIVLETDPLTGDTLEWLRLDPLPDVIERKALEALLNARHCFDQIMYFANQLASGVTQKKGPNFPWADSEAALKSDRLKKITPQLHECLIDLRPFPDPDDPVSLQSLATYMATIANDKHSIGLVPQPVINSTTISAIGNFVVPGLRWDPVKRQALHRRWSGPDPETASIEYSFTLNLVHAALPLPVPLIGALEVFIEYAQEVLEALRMAANANAPVASPAATSPQLGQRIEFRAHAPRGTSGTPPHGNMYALNDPGEKGRAFVFERPALLEKRYYRFVGSLIGTSPEGYPLVLIDEIELDGPGTAGRWEDGEAICGPPGITWETPATVFEASLTDEGIPPGAILWQSLPLGEAAEKAQGSSRSLSDLLIRLDDGSREWTANDIPPLAMLYWGL